MFMGLPGVHRLRNRKPDRAHQVAQGKSRTAQALSGPPVAHAEGVRYGGIAGELNRRGIRETDEWKGRNGEPIAGAATRPAGQSVAVDRPRHMGTASLPWAPEHSTHGQVHRIRPEPGSRTSGAELRAPAIRASLPEIDEHNFGVLTLRAFEGAPVITGRVWFDAS
jgi:hypothetical protein